MATPATIDDLLKLIRKSGMIDDGKLDAYLDRLKAAGTPPFDVKKLAGAMVKDGLLTYFQAEQFILGKWRGFTIGKYKLLERIGFGGMGQVFLCEHMYMRRRVAIKVLPPAKAEEPAALGRFYREARAAAALDHPNIVRTHDIDQDGNLHFLVMEYVEGASLLDAVKKTGPMDWRRACHYIWQSTQGLDHAYRVGIIHRDIKPGNILIDRFGISKILDMGLARFYHGDDDNLTLKYDEKSVLGTADYVAPEQTVNSHDVDVRADIYALGATFYFLLAGHPPFPDGTIAQKLLAHQTREPTPMRSLRPDVPEEVLAILTKMMAKRLDERFQTPTDIYEALLPFVQTQIALPPDAEMPVLSPAARERINETSSSSSASLSGSFRQDSAILRAELMQRSGRMTPPSGTQRPPAEAVRATATHTAYAPPMGPGGSSSRVQPLVQHQGQHGGVDTGRMHGSTARTPMVGQPTPMPTPRQIQPIGPASQYDEGVRQNDSAAGVFNLLGRSFMLRLVIEIGLIAALIAGAYFIFKN